MRFLGILDLFNSPIVIILIVVVVFAAIVCLISLKPNPRHLKEEVEEVLKAANIEYEITDPTSKNYTFDLKINNQSYTVLVLPIEKHAEVTINNFNTWEMHYGGGDRPGKAQPYKQMIAEIPAFMKVETSNKKLVLVRPNAKKIVCWKNECEMIFIEPNTEIYGVNVLNLTALPYFINECEKKDVK